MRKAREISIHNLLIDNKKGFKTVHDWRLFYALVSMLDPAEPYESYITSEEYAALLDKPKGYCREKLKEGEHRVGNWYIEVEGNRIPFVIGAVYTTNELKVRWNGEILEYLNPFLGLMKKVGMLDGCL